MSVASDFLSGIGKRFCRSVYIGRQKELSSALLTDEEIRDLSYRADELDRVGEHPHEVAHRQYGDARSVYRGFGMDYEESRPYQSGDDFRFMNWRHSARTGELHMKVFREERQPSVFILVDRRSNMRFGTQKRLKVTQAVRVASLLAFSAQNHNTPVGGVLLEEELEWVSEFHNNSGAYTFINAANQACPPLEEGIKEQATTHVIRLLQNMLVQGSIVYLIGDFHDINQESHSELLQLSCEHRVYAIKIIDEAEVHLPQAGELEFLVGESNVVEINTNNKQVQQDYNNLVQEKSDTQKKIFSSAGIAYVEIHSDDDAIENSVPLS